MTSTVDTHIIPPEGLADAIVATLRAAPRTINELSRLTGYSTSAVNSRLYELFDDDQVYRKTGGRSHLWCYGRPDGSPPPVKVKGLRRDPLVTALFGPAPFSVSGASGTPSPIVDATPAAAADVAPAGVRGLALDKEH